MAISKLVYCVRARHAVQASIYHGVQLPIIKITNAAEVVSKLILLFRYPTWFIANPVLWHQIEKVHNFTMQIKLPAAHLQDSCYILIVS